METFRLYVVRDSAEPATVGALRALLALVPRLNGRGRWFEVVAVERGRLADVRAELRAAGASALPALLEIDPSPRDDGGPPAAQCVAEYVGPVVEALEALAAAPPRAPRARGVPQSVEEYREWMRATMGTAADVAEGRMTGGDGDDDGLGGALSPKDMNRRLDDFNTRRQQVGMKPTPRGGRQPAPGRSQRRRKIVPQGAGDDRARARAQRVASESESEEERPAPRSARAPRRAAGVHRQAPAALGAGNDVADIQHALKRSGTGSKEAAMLATMFGNQAVTPG